MIHSHDTEGKGIMSLLIDPTVTGKTLIALSAYQSIALSLYLAISILRLRTSRAMVMVMLMLCVCVCVCVSSV